MKDALGGVINIWFIAVFIIVISAYLAFSVQYNKAFRMKNEIIKAIEQCDGKIDGCADEIIDDYKTKIGYNVPNTWTFELCKSSSECIEKDGYKVIPHLVDEGDSSKQIGERYYYTVATAVNTDIPVFRNMIPNMSVFQVSGNTKRIRKH